MRRTQVNEIFLEAYDCRVNIINDIAAIKSGADQGSTLSNIHANIDKIIELLGGNQIKKFYLIFKTLFTAYQFLVQWEDDVKNAAENANRFHEAYKYRIKEALKQVQGLENAKEVSDIISPMGNIEVTDNISKALECLSVLSLPIPVYWEEDPKESKSYPSMKEMYKEKEPEVVAFLEFKIDNNNLQEPHLIGPNKQYDLNLEVRLNRWPNGSNKLVIQPLSDIPQENYQMPIFEFIRNDENKTYNSTKKMIIKFEQTFESQPLEFIYQSYLLPGQKVIAVTGNNRIKIRSSLESNLVISGYSEADRALCEIRTSILNEAGITSEQRINFLLIMKNLANIAGQALASNDFSGSWSEEDFQKEIRRRLRLVSEIGCQLSEHPHVAGGITDLFFKKLQIELKVENNKLVTLINANSFSQQGAQYTAGCDNRLGVLCILDCSDKKQAPGSLANDVDLIRVPVPGIVDGGFPLVLGVVIIRGNLKAPSSFSK